MLTVSSTLNRLCDSPPRQVPSKPSLEHVALMPCARGQLFLYLRARGWSYEYSSNDARNDRDLCRILPRIFSSKPKWHVAWSKPFPNLVWVGVPAPAPAPAPTPPSAAALANSTEPAPAPAVAAVPALAPAVAPARSRASTHIGACARARVRVAPAESSGGNHPKPAGDGPPTIGDAREHVGRARSRDAHSAARECGGGDDDDSEVQNEVGSSSFRKDVRLLLFD